uniref:Uncharacterized protein n=1 Tax=Entomoneis paludosa TaxID=265537 RepID=A0A7S2Y879_9STRA|mmetsp:Transcript_22087/g.46053  ORF Transcript_22087/g.46053 Transcript_22087/m.46053 type:complete len:418 (+) Transcript_22087:244-1497(+)
MSVDVDAVNERLNGLVTLLKAVGVDGDDLTGSGSKKSGSSANEGALDMAKQLNDDQIEAIIKKLQQAQAEAPQIIAALEAHAEARSLTDGGGSTSKPKKAEPEEVVVEEEEEEDDDEFDEDANYPMVGHGVSDDCSVVSDLTTPTVVNSPHIPEEEHYKETLPPMIVGGVGEPSMIISAPKRKNLVSQVRPAGALAPPGSRRGGRGAPPHMSATASGAAAARRRMYQETMTKLTSENPSGGGMGYTGVPNVPQAPAPSAKASPSTKPASKSKSGEKPKKKSSKKSSSSSQGPTAPSSASDGWNTFEEPAPAPKKKAGGPTVIDDDGFLVGESFDPFATGNNPFKSSAGDLEFGGGDKFSSNNSTGFASFDDNRSASNESKGKSRKPKTKKTADGERKTSTKRSSGSAPRRSRRASAV